MFVNHLGLVSEIKAISYSELSRAGAALQKQLTRDFGPIWGVDATIDTFGRLEDLPLGYWPVVIEKDIKTAGAAGVHLDKDGQPFALVQYSNRWTLTASHEVLEMCADPFGNRLMASKSVMPDQGRVQYLVEVCDPCEAPDFAYHVNGVAVSDFYTPHFFDPVASPSMRYSFTGALTEPRQVLKAGYLSWHDPVTNHWWQETFFDSSPTFRDLGAMSGSAGSIRAMIDGMTQVPDLLEDVPSGSPFLQAAQESGEAAGAASAAKAESLRAQIRELKGAK
jgi:hypothetical protein